MKRLTGSILSLAVAVVAGLALAAPRLSLAQTPLTSVPGSPFTFFGGSNSNNVRLSPDEKHLFVSNNYSNSVTVLDVAPSGSLALHGVYTASYTPYYLFVSGLTTNPAGDRLYVVGIDFSGYGSVAVHSIAGDGTLTWMQDAALASPSFAQNGIAYVSQSGGDFVYVNNNAQPNTVSGFSVAADGTLAPLADSPTGGNGSYGFYASSSLRAAGARLFVMNGGYSNSASNNVTVFNIGTDGSLSPVTGSPFALPSGNYTSGPLAVDPAGAFVYVGTVYGPVVKFSIGANGALTSLGAFPFTPYDEPVDDLAVHPSGAYLVASGFWNARLKVMDTATMRPLFGSPQSSDSPYFQTGGISLDAAGGRVFIGSNVDYGYLSVSAYAFTPTPPIPRLTIELKVTGTSLDKFGAATITGTLTSSLPMSFPVTLTLRQKQGHKIVTVSAGLYVTTQGINGTATWSWKASSDTQAFKGGTAELIAVTYGYDPVTNEQVTASLNQAVQLNSK